MLGSNDFFYFDNLKRKICLIVVIILSLQSVANRNIQMKRLKVSEVIRLLLDDGWFLYAQKGSHRQFKHSEKLGKVTVNGKNSDTLSQEILNSIFKQAGWK